MWVERLVTRTTQPQDAVGIDWSNPITRALSFAFNPATGAANLVDRKLATTNNTSRRVSHNGVFAKGAASQRNIEWANYEPVKTSDGNGTGDFTLVAFSNPPLASGGVSQHIFAQKNDGGGSPFAQAQLAAHYNFTVGAHEEGKFTFAIYSPAGNQIAETPFSIDGQWHMWSGVRSGTTMTLCRDANVLSSTTSTVRSILQAAPRYLALGGQGNTTASALTEGIGYSFAFNRALSDAELKSLSENPWQIFEQEVTRIWVDDATEAAPPSGPIGTLSATETGQDTAAFTGKVIVTGTLAATEVVSDTAALNGSAAVTTTGTLAATEQGADTAAITGKVLVQGALSATEVGSDTALINGSSVIITTGSINADESGGDTAAMTGKVLVQALIDAAEQGADTAQLAGQIVIKGTLAAVEVGSDTAAIYSTAPVIYTPGAQTRPSRLQSSSRPSRIQAGTRASR